MNPTIPFYMILAVAVAIIAGIAFCCSIVWFILLKPFLHKYKTIFIHLEEMRDEE